MLVNNLVSLEECYEHLRIDYDAFGSADDPWLNVFIPAVSQTIAAWVKDEERLYQYSIDTDGSHVLLLDEEGLPIPKPQVKVAALLEIASQYRYREGEGKDNQVTSDAGYGYMLSKGATALLTPLRTPTAT